MHIRRRHRLSHGFGHLGHHLCGRASGRIHAVVRHVFQALQTQLIKSRYIGQRGLAFAAQHGQDAHLARLLVFHKVLHRPDTCRNLVAHHVSQHGCAAPVRRSQQIRAVALVDHLDQKLGRRCRRRDAHSALATLFFDPLQVFVKGFDTQARRHGQGIDEAGKTGHRHKVGMRIEPWVLDHLGQDGDGVVVGDEEGQPIRRRGFQHLRGDLAARTGAVIHQHRSAQAVLHLLGQQAGNRIRAAAWRETHQQPHGLALAIARRPTGQSSHTGRSRTSGQQLLREMSTAQGHTGFLRGQKDNQSGQAGLVLGQLDTHLSRRRAAQRIAGVERAFQAQCLKHIGFDVGIESLQLGQRQFG